ncbi:hypothetical protein, conserved [Eimeria praecox]|uniref:Uncharacterized protein n=1 Tax=Eimeria praecox TaxID=51316 RepID=U6GZW1_9EIME|nr:hypothetical protein, conserved [Eimeria praecox]
MMQQPTKAQPSFPSRVLNVEKKPLGAQPRWPPEDAPAPAVQRMEEGLQQLVKADLHRFGVLTHARAPNPTYAFPPRRRKPKEIQLKSAYRPAETQPWDYLQLPGGLTPRLEDPYAPKGSPSVPEPEPQQPTLEELWFAAAEENLNATERQRRPPALPYPDWGRRGEPSKATAHAADRTSCTEDETLEDEDRRLLSPDETDSEGPLEALPALTEDVFLRGPGGPPLSEESRRHLLRFGLDYKEALSPRSRRHRNKHPKEKTVPFALLREYGAFIDEITSCGLLQEQQLKAHQLQQQHQQLQQQHQQLQQQHQQLQQQHQQLQHQELQQEHQELQQEHQELQQQHQELQQQHQELQQQHQLLQQQHQELQQQHQELLQQQHQLQQQRQDLMLNTLL